MLLWSQWLTTCWAEGNTWLKHCMYVLLSITWWSAQKQGNSFTMDWKSLQDTGWCNNCAHEHMGSVVLLLCTPHPTHLPLGPRHCSIAILLHHTDLRRKGGGDGPGWGSLHTNHNSHLLLLYIVHFGCHFHHRFLTTCCYKLKICKLWEPPKIKAIAYYICRYTRHTDKKSPQVFSSLKLQLMLLPCYVYCCLIITLPPSGAHIMQ
jgi:hypothetical protein